MQEDLSSNLLPPAPEKRIIKHLVISGGVIYGYSFYGALRHLHQHHVWSMDHLQSIYATSIGAILGVVLALKLEWEVLDNYFVNRPWHEVFRFNMSTVMNCFQQCGLFSKHILEEILYPLFAASDLNIGTVTLHQLYEFTGVDLHVFTVNLTTFAEVDVSHTTHPQWRVLDAVYASSAAPVIFQPMMYGNDWYADGGFLINYPVEPCRRAAEHPQDILGIHTQSMDADAGLPVNANLYDYVRLIFAKLMRIAAHPNEPGGEGGRSQELFIPPTLMPIYDVVSLAGSPEKRQELIDHGVAAAERFLQEEPRTLRSPLHCAVPPPSKEVFEAR